MFSNIYLLSNVIKTFSRIRGSVSHLNRKLISPDFFGVEHLVQQNFGLGLGLDRVSIFGIVYFFTLPDLYLNCVLAAVLESIKYRVEGDLRPCVIYIFVYIYGLPII